MVPHTSDGRVMFAIPWHGHTLVGTTDTPIAEAPLEPVAMEQEIEFILQTAALYLEQTAGARRHPQRLRRHPPSEPRGSAPRDRPSALSRDHTIRVEPSGILTITRRQVDDLPPHGRALRRRGGEAWRPCRLPPSVTRDLPIHGSHPDAAQFGHLSVYGSDARIDRGAARRRSACIPRSRTRRPK